MKSAANLYSLLGLALVAVGLALIPIAYLLLRSVPLTASGLSMLILGSVSYVLGRTRPRLSPEVSVILLETGLENIGAVLEELGLRSKAVYVPSSIGGGRSRALMPLHANGQSPSLRIQGALPRRLIVKYGQQGDELGLLLSTPGSAAADMLEAKPGEGIPDIESALAAILEGTLDLVDGVRVTGTGDSVTVQVSNPRMEYKKIVLYDCLGSPLASIVASVTSEALNKPVVIDREIWEKGKGTVTLKVLA